jgi:hypothetical protein
MSNGDSARSEFIDSSNSSLRNNGEPRNEESSSSTQRSESLTGTHAASTSGVGGSSNTVAEDERLLLLQELEASVESFRGGKISKTTAISNVLGILGKESNVSYSQSQKEATFDSYLTEIMSIQAALDRADPSGRAPQTPSTLEEGVRKRGTDRDDDAESDSGGETGKSHKRVKLLESEMPWHIPSDSSSADAGNPSCQETCRLLRTYNRDISGAKFFVKVAPNSPSGIPSSQWERILKGDAIDLNQIFASLHHTVPDEERTGRMGDTEISFGVPEAKKKIHTAAEWSSAWRRASKAIVFAFPHRREELLEYGDYIESEFAAKVSSSHSKLILFDVALRNEVAAGQHCLLTDFNRFSRLYSAIVLPDGIEGHTDKPSGKKSSGSKQGSGKPEICNKFNSGTCKNADADCKYQHLCRNCRKPGHGKKDCTEGAK